MSLPKLRDIGSIGVVTDLDPHDLPPNGFSFAQNVRFRNSKVSSAPLFKNVANLGTSNPRFLCAFTPSAGLDFSFIAYLNGTVNRYSVANGEQNYSVSGASPLSGETIWTSTYLQGVMYVNSSGYVPWGLLPGGTAFINLQNMDSTWSANILRVCNNSLVALNVNKAGTIYQNMVKTSSTALEGAMPSSWAVGVPGSNALENQLGQMQGPITDGQTLGQSLMIYGQYEAWLMMPSGDFNIFNFIKLPFTKGSINANCSVEIAGRNYIFGMDDIWVTDGTTENSICDQRVRDFIFGNINMSKTNRCFVAHNQQLHELHFNFYSGDGYASFNQSNVSDGCNRCAVYDYVYDKWTFDDRPQVYGSARCNFDSVPTWTSDALEWATETGTWQSGDDSAKRVMAYIGDVNSFYGLTERIYAFDPYATSLPGMPVAVTGFPIDKKASSFPYAERDAVDMSSLGADLKDYTLVSFLLPLARLDPNAANTLNFAVGASDFYDETPTYTPYQGYDGETLYKVDTNMAGRYLYFKAQFPDYTAFTWSGFDFDADVVGQR